jgi:3-hydroxyisobutyrate dehydrogenase-like beta-hydroxyacid dehydrogenase
MGQKTFVIDENPPSANVVKITGNFLITVVLEGLAEAFSLVRKSGVDPNKFLEILTGSLFAAPIFKTYGRMIAAGQFEPVGFRLPLGVKDNRLVAALAQGLSESDWSAIARLSFQVAGLEKAA